MYKVTNLAQGPFLQRTWEKWKYIEKRIIGQKRKGKGIKNPSIEDTGFTRS